VAGATPLPKNRVAGPPPFWPRGGFGHPIRPVWGGRSHPQAFGGGPATPKATKKKKKKKTKWVCAVGGGRTTPKGLGVVVGGPKPPQALGGGPATPNGTNPFRFFFFFFFFFSWWLSGWPDHPQRPGGGFGHPIPAVWGGRSHPLAKKGVVRPPHFWARGWLQPPPTQFLFFFFFFSFLLKKKKKKKKKSEMGQNAVLGKTRRFGRAQNGVVLE
jgi:hypothetical protein